MVRGIFFKQRSDQLCSLLKLLYLGLALALPWPPSPLPYRTRPWFNLLHLLPHTLPSATQLFLLICRHSHLILLQAFVLAGTSALHTHPPDFARVHSNANFSERLPDTPLLRRAPHPHDPLILLAFSS